MAHERVHVVESDEEFDALLASSATNPGSLVVVDFFAVWCGPCRRIAPLYEQLSTQFPQVIFLKVDGDRLKTTTRKCGINAYPTFQFYVQGIKVYEIRGANEAELREALYHFAPSGPAVKGIVVEEKESPYSTFPQKQCVFFGSLEMIGGCITKIAEFNEQMKADANNRALALTDEEYDQLFHIRAILQDTSHYHSTNFAPAHYSPFVKLLEWPLRLRFPAIDLLRLLILHPDAASYLGISATSAIPTSFAEAQAHPFITKIVSANALEAAFGEAPVLLMSLRFIANMFRHTTLRNLTPALFDSVRNVAKKLVDLSTSSKVSSNKNVQIAMATVLLNYAAAFNETAPPESRQQAFGSVLSYTRGMAENCPKEFDDEAKYRLMVAAGTLLYKVRSLARVNAAHLSVLMASPVLTQAESTKVKAVMAELKAFLGSSE